MRRHTPPAKEGGSDVAGAGDAGADIAGAADGSKEGSSGCVGGEEVVLRAGTGAEWSGVPPVGVAGSLGKSEKQSGCSVNGEVVEVKLSVSGSAVVAIRPEEARGEEGRLKSHPPASRTSVAQPSSASWRPSSFASWAVTREPVGTLVARPRVRAAQVARAWAGSMVEPLGLVGGLCG